MPHVPVDQETIRLLNQRNWMNRHIEKAMRKRRYTGMFPEDDWPLWRKAIPNIAAGIFLTVYMIGLLLLARWFGQAF